MEFVPALLVKVTVIFAAGLVATAFVRRTSAALRHVVLLTSLVCALSLPLMMFVSPTWDVRVLSPAAPSSLDASAQLRAANATLLASPTDRTFLAAGNDHKNGSTVGSSTSMAAEQSARLDRDAWLIWLAWIVGLVGVATWLTIGRLRLRRIARDAWPLVSRDWQALLNAVRAEADVAREVKLASSSFVSTPLTWGTRAPVILLPDDALDWGEEHRRVVLRHEMAHVSRRDSLVQLVAGFVCAVYWFHPLVWIIERRLRAECERACDDQVVSLGTPATDYAAHLLEVARSARAFGAPGFLSVAMARPSQLEGRLLAVLSGSGQRVASRTERFAAVAISLLLLLPIAAFRPVERQVSVTTTIASRQQTPTPAIVAQPVAPIATNVGQPAAAIATDDEPVVTTVYEQEKNFDSSFTLSAPVSKGGTLHLDLKTGGAITIEGWDKPEVYVRARLGGRNWRDTRVTLEPANGNATLHSDFTRSLRNSSTSHDFDIQVPREFNVEVESSGGSITIANVNGTFSGQTGGGEITLRTVNGKVDLATGGGEIYVVDSNVDGSVSTGGGRARVVRVNGNLRASSGGGPVIYSESNGTGSGYGAGRGNAASANASSSAEGSGSGSASATSNGGPIRMNSAGGDISLPTAPSGARVTTGGGTITIGSSGGAVYAQTGGGDIEIGPTSGSVEAITGAGDVAVDFRGRGSVDVASGNGRVVITTPSDLNATLELTTAYTRNLGRKTRIISDWPVSVTETTEWDDSNGTPRRYVRVRQQVGSGGPLIRVNTVNGDIVLRKGS